MGYITNFIVYTLAMVGVIVVALLVFKNATSVNGGGKTSKYLKVIDTMSIGPRKTLYIVSAGSEKFLIAGDVDKTTLISKLEPQARDAAAQDIVQTPCQEPDAQSFKATLAGMPKQSFMDRSNIGIKSSIMSNKGNSVMKNIADILKK